MKLTTAPREEDEAGSALYDAVDAPCRLGEAEAPQPHLVALRGLDLEVEPADARDVGLRFDRDWLVVRVEEFEVAHRELADTVAARRVVRCLGELSDAEEKEEAEQAGELENLVVLALERQRSDEVDHLGCDGHHALRGSENFLIAPRTAFVIGLLAAFKSTTTLQSE